jgi:uncharacterized protein (TIGR02246 family)
MSRWIVTAGVALFTATKISAFDPLVVPSKSWAVFWQNKDLERVLSLYTDDAVFMDADGSRVSGKPALRKFFSAVLKQYSAQPLLRSVAHASSGDLGYDWGDYDEVVSPMSNPSNAIETHGTYLVILKRVSGRWLIASQMWTGNVPVPVKR